MQSNLAIDHVAADSAPPRPVAGPNERLPIAGKRTVVNQRSQHAFTPALFQVEEACRLRQSQLQSRHLAVLGSNAAVKVRILV